jgi:hypothetical protein
MLGDFVPFAVNLYSPPELLRNPASSGFDTSVAISETRIATDLSMAPAAVSPGGSFTATVSGPRFDNETYLDVRYRRPNSTRDEIAFNWQIGMSATHLVSPGTEPGTWTITGIRPHSNRNDRSGDFFPVSVALTVDSRN